MNKAGIFYHNMRNLLKNKNAQIMKNDSRSSIPQVEEEKKKYTDRDVNRDDHARRFQHTTSQPIKWILHTVDNKILHNLPIFLEDVGMTEDIYGTSVPHLQGKKSRHKIHHVEPITVPNVLKGILDKYKKGTLCCDLIHINSIGFLKTIYWHIVFAMVSMIKIEKLITLKI